MPDTLSAFPRAGTLSEESVERYLDELAPTARVLSRRHVGDLLAQHLVVARSGVSIIGSRRSPGRPAPQGGLLGRRTETVQLGRRNAAHLVEGVRKQADLVRAELADDIPVVAMLCILDADWPLFGGAFTVDGVRVLWPKKAAQVISSGAQLTESDVTRVADQLDATFAPAPNDTHRRRR